MSDNDEQKIYIDFKLNNTLRKYKENDNILYTVGIDNYILGFIRISAKSEENESQNYNIEEKYLKKIKNILPIGLYINGVIAIYNENTFEDFETVLNEQLEKIKEINSDLFIAKSKEARTMKGENKEKMKMKIFIIFFLNMILAPLLI